MSGPAAAAVTVREARPDEHEEVGRITVAAYREFVRDGDADWHEYLETIANVEGRADRTTILVAVDAGRIVGSATLELFDRVERDDDPPLHPDEAHIRMLGVHPSARRLGVARTLIDACFERSAAAGKTFMTLHTTSRMTAAQAMYDTLGFQRLADRVFPDGFVLLTYRREIER